MQALLGLAGLALLASMVSFGLYGWDKRAAQQGSWRVAERTLHLWALLGGWPGAWLAQRQFRHKTQKVSFRVLFWLTVLVHSGVVLGVCVLLQRRPAW